MNEPKTVAPAAMIAASTPSDMDVSGSTAIQVGHDVRSVLDLREPSPKFLDPRGALRADHPGEDVASGLLGELATDTALPGVREDGRYLVAQVQRFEQFPLAAV